MADDVAAVRSGVPAGAAAGAEAEAEGEGAEGDGTPQLELGGEEGGVVVAVVGEDDEEEVEVETYEVSAAWEGEGEEGAAGGQGGQRGRDEMAELMADLYPEGLGGERPPRRRGGVRGPMVGQQLPFPSTALSRGGGVTPVFRKKVERVTRGELRRRREQERMELNEAAVAAAEVASRGAAALLDGVDVEAEERRLQEAQRLEDAGEAWRAMVLAAKARAKGKAEEEVEREEEEVGVAAFVEGKAAEWEGEGLESFLRRAVVLGGEPEEAEDEGEEEDAELVEGFKVVDPTELMTEEDLKAYAAMAESVSASASSAADFEAEARLYEEGRYGADHGEFEVEGEEGGALLDVDADDPMAVREAAAAAAAKAKVVVSQGAQRGGKGVAFEEEEDKEEEEDRTGGAGIGALDDAARADEGRSDASLFEEMMATLEAAPARKKEE